ncbi:MAG: hypothetical protein RLZZ465_217 [Bacteroidota bacterium]
MFCAGLLDVLGRMRDFEVGEQELVAALDEGLHGGWLLVEQRPKPVVVVFVEGRFSVGGLPGLFVGSQPVFAVVDADLWEGEVAVLAMHGDGEGLEVVGGGDGISVAAILLEEGRVLEDGELLLLLSEDKPSHIGEEGVWEDHRGR